MSGDHRNSPLFDVALNLLEVGTTHTARRHVEQQLAFRRLRIGDLLEPQRLSVDWSRFVQQLRPHIKARRAVRSFR